MTELDKLEEKLKEKGYKYKRIDDVHMYQSEYVKEEQDVGRHQIVVFDENDEKIWDAICQYGSYGHDKGLLEVMGEGVVLPGHGDSVAGYLTADEVMERYQKYLDGDIDEPRYNLLIQRKQGGDWTDEWLSEITISQLTDEIQRWNEKYVLILWGLDSDYNTITFRAFPRKKVEKGE